jgi:antitoxin MazE
MAQAVGLIEGAKVEIEAKNNRIVIIPVRPKYNLADLLKGTAPEEYRKNAVDWGPDRGREVVD